MPNSIDDPEFVRKLVGALIEEFPEQSIDLHAHDLYGEAIPAYVAAIEAAVGRGHSIGVDVLHPAIAGNTAQPSITKVIDTLRRAHGAIKENLPCIDVGPINTDKESLLALRFKYRDAEICPSARLLKAMYKARVPGGASATLRSIPGLEKNLQNALGTTDWEEIQLAIYEMQARILPRLGNPTQVTPYALMTTKEAAFAVLRQKMGLDPLSSLTPETVDYLTGALGRVPESVEPGLIALALKSKPRTQFVPATELPSGLPAARAALAEAGVSDPTNWELLTAAVLKDQSSPKRGLKHVVGLRAGTVKPQIWPEPDFTAPGQRQANWIAKGRRPGLQPGSLRPSVAEVLKSNTYLLEAIAQDMVELDRYARQPFSLSVQPVYGPRMDVEDREIVDLTRMQHARTVLNFNMDQFLCRLEWAGAPRRDILSSVLGLERLIAETCRRKGVQDVSLIPSLKDHWYVFPRYEAGDPDLAAGQ